MLDRLRLLDGPDAVLAMSYSFSKLSLERMQGVDKRLQDLAFKVIQVHDCQVLEYGGLRTEAIQRKLMAEGRSWTMNSRHLTGYAIDLAPYPIDWKNMKRFYFFSGIVWDAAHTLGIPIRWGGDWDRDYDFDDQKKFDLVHFEIPEGME